MKGFVLSLSAFFSSQAPTVGVGILSWRGYDSLRAALASYARADFFGLFNEKLLFLPEIESVGEEVARAFGIPCAGSAENLGILGGFQALAAAMTSDYVLLLENDFSLIEDRESAAAQLFRGVAALESGEADVFRFRHRYQPGVPFQLSKVMAYWPPEGASFVDRAVAALRRAVRPGKARRFSGSTVFYREDGAERFPRDVTRTGAGDFLVSSRVLNWSNNPFLIRRDFFLNTIIPAALERMGRRLVNGFPTIEIELNDPWWRAQDFRIGIANPGLFTHQRMNDRGY